MRYISKSFTVIIFPTSSSVSKLFWPTISGASFTGVISMWNSKISLSSVPSLIAIFTIKSPLKFSIGVIVVPFVV